MTVKNKSVVIDTDALIKDIESKLETSMKNFKEYLDRTSPNRIDLIKLKALQIGEQKMGDLEKTGEICFIPSGIKSVNVQFTNPSQSQSIIRKITTAAIENHYSVREQDFMLIISLKPITEDTRKQIVHDIKNEKEKYKQIINHHRGQAQKTIKDLAEDQKRQTSKKIDNIKDKSIFSLEEMYKKKEQEIMK